MHHWDAEANSLKRGAPILHGGVTLGQGVMRRSFILPRLLASFLMTVVGVCVFEPTASAVEVSDPIDNFLGRWDLPGTLTWIEIREDHSIVHSTLGAGDIRAENGDYFEILYRANYLACRYQIKKYSEEELSAVVYLKTDSSDCQLGVLRRSPQQLKKSGDDTRGRRLAKSDLPAPGSGEPFKDCEKCPELVTVPSGSFVMGSPNYEQGRYDDEGPQRRVIFKSSFAVGRFSVTVEEFAAFVVETGYRSGDTCGVNHGDATSAGSFEAPPGFDPGFVQTGKNPAVCVSWHDAKAYTEWLSNKTKQHYRLLSEAEREYVARAGTSTPYWWGTGITPAQAMYDSRTVVETKPKGDSKAKKPSPLSAVKADAQSITKASDAPPGRTAPVQSYKPNDWGLYQVHGNVSEWTEDCWIPSMLSSSDSGAPVVVPNCSEHVLRGGAWSYWPSLLRSAYREHGPAEGRYNQIGFRVARDVAGIQ